MSVPESKDYLDLKAIVTLLILTLLWGFNFSTIKYLNQGISPVFASTLRSLIASVFGLAYCIWRKEKLFHTDVRLFHGFMVGLGVEIAQEQEPLPRNYRDLRATIVYGMPLQVWRF